jgi:hypothetical protein
VTSLADGVGGAFVTVTVVTALVWLVSRPLT